MALRKRFFESLKFCDICTKDVSNYCWNTDCKHYACCDTQPLASIINGGPDGQVDQDRNDPNDRMDWFGSHFQFNTSWSYFRIFGI